MKGMSTIVKNISGLVKMFIFLFGIYIISYGYSGPGGGFAGGVILAASFVLLMLAFGREFVEKNLPLRLVLIIACIGILGFITVAIAGLCYGPTGFFWNFLHQKYPDFISSGIISVAEFFIGLLVGSLSFLVIFSLSAYRPDISAGEKA
ncbi:MAG: MnhB domain-containing protein [Planctomycetota bacterium]|jgi:multicomponent Na+:H+ antiporter subunit B